MRNKTTRGILAPRRGELLAGFGRQHSLAHQASARLEHAGGKVAALLIADGQGVTPKRWPLVSHTDPPGPNIRQIASQSRPWKHKNPGPDAARARNRSSLLAARRAGKGRSGKTPKPSNSKVPALHREAGGDTTMSIGRQHFVHTSIDPAVQGKHQTAGTRVLSTEGSLRAN
jgi:hypothetical protein